MHTPEKMPTLADIRRRAKQEAEDSAQWSGRRIQMLNYTSDDSAVILSETDPSSASPSAKMGDKHDKTVKRPTSAQLYRYYCSVCGVMAAVSNAAIVRPDDDHENSVGPEAVPRRGTDGAIVVTDDYFLKLYTSTNAERRLLKRFNGIEVQYRLKCTGCGLPVCYKTTDDSAAVNASAVMHPSSKCTFFFKEGIVAKQQSAARFASPAVQPSS
eukprot:Lankesteria_metandrocarpae@DN2143_c0_g1_i1.p1